MKNGAERTIAKVQDRFWIAWWSAVAIFIANLFGALRSWYAFLFMCHHKTLLIPTFLLSLLFFPPLVLYLLRLCARFCLTVVSFGSLFLLLLFFFSSRSSFSKECLSGAHRFSSHCHATHKRCGDDKCLICVCTHDAVTMSINSDRRRQHAREKKNTNQRKTKVFHEWICRCCRRRSHIYDMRKFMWSQALNLT